MSDLDESKFGTASIELMRACRRYIHESNERMKAMEKELEMLRAIDSSILEVQTERLKKKTKLTQVEMLSLVQDIMKGERR